MALERVDNIGDTTTSTGTGTINLAAVAQAGALIFAGNVTSGATVRYDIRSADNTEWEIGEGVFTDGAPDTLSRVTVYKSSNAGSLVDFSAGTKNVSMVFTILDLSPLYSPPEGTVVNGKIVVTDTGSGLNVALKGKDGNDPSATNPVYAMIAGSLRTITTALSKTLADGTSWFGSGSANYATLERDYFVYLGYNTTDGVVIGFSPFPGANQYSDFSVTTTDEKYCGISTITNAAATDYYQIIGRFGATLSATAAFTWSVPTFTAINLIQRPIYSSRVLTWIPTLTGFTTPPTTAFRYRIERDTVYIPAANFGDATSNATTFTLTLPFKNLVANDFAVIGFCGDNTTQVTTPAILTTANNSATATLYKAWNTTAWTNTGQKYFRSSPWFYQI